MTPSLPAAQPPEEEEAVWEHAATLSLECIGGWDVALGINAPATPVASSGLALEPEQDAAASWSLSSGSGGERHDRHRSISLKN